MPRIRIGLVRLNLEDAQLAVYFYVGLSTLLHVAPTPYIIRNPAFQSQAQTRKRENENFQCVAPSHKPQFLWIPWNLYCPPLWVKVFLHVKLRTSNNTCPLVVWKIFSFMQGWQRRREKDDAFAKKQVWKMHSDWIDGKLLTSQYWLRHH